MKFRFEFIIFLLNEFLKAFVRLYYGKNEIKLKTDVCTIELTLFRETRDLSYKNSKTVRVLYVICEDDNTNGSFQSDNIEYNKLENAINRISLNIELLQSFIAEQVYKEFQIRRTFLLRTDLTFDSTNEHVCEVFKTKLSLNKALSMSSNELYLYLAEEIKSNKEFFNPNCKYLALLSFTRYEYRQDFDIFQNTKGFCALGKKYLIK